MNNIERLFSPWLLNDLKAYSDQITETQRRARILRIWNKCMLHGHPSIAAKIKEKYPDAIRIKSDIVMATAMALAYDIKAKK